jgi:hypothetical protein
MNVTLGEAVVVFDGTPEGGERRALIVIFCLHSMNDNAITAKFINSPKNLTANTYLLKIENKTHL